MKKMMMIGLCVLLAIVPSVCAMRTDLTLEASAITSVATVKFDSDTYTIPVNSVSVLNLCVFDVQRCTCWQAYIYFDKTIVNEISIIEGPFLKQAGYTWLYKQINNNYNATHGRIVLADTLLGMNRMANGTGVLATITFKAVSYGTTLLHLDNVLLGDEHIPPHAIAEVVFDSNINVI